VDGTLCFDETTNELLYVNMIQPNLSATDSLTNTSQSVFSALGGVSTLADISTFNDGNAVSNWFLKAILVVFEKSLSQH
jgi:hypothetical protein